MILAYPSQIGSADAGVLAAGHPSAWERSSPLLLDLGGASVYLGENLRSPAALDSAPVTSLTAMALGVIHGALLCEAEDFPVPVFAEIVQQTFPTAAEAMDGLLSSIVENRFDDPEAALKTYAAPISAWARNGANAGSTRSSSSSSTACSPRASNRDTATGTVFGHQGMAESPLR